MDDDDDEGWGAVFAKASGATTTTTTTALPIIGHGVEDPSRAALRDDATSTVKRHNKRRRRTNAHTFCDLQKDKEHFLRYIRSRGEDVPKLQTDSSFCPSWARLGHCLGLERQQGQDCRAVPVEQGSFVVCEVCGGTTSHHALVVVEDTSCPTTTTTPSRTLVLQQVFCHVRNLRCCGSMRATTRRNVRGLTKRYRTMVQQETRRFRHCADRVVNELSGFNAGEAELLATKCEAVVHWAKRMLEPIFWKQDETQQPQQRQEVFEHAVRCMISCDQLYLRLYYLQVTGQLSMWLSAMVDQHGMDGGPWFLPHPIEYFRITWDMTTASATAIHDYLHNDLLEEEKRCADPRRNPTANVRGWRCSLFQRYGLAGDTANCGRDPLRVLHQNRFLETAELFRSWKTWPSTLQQWRQILDKDRFPSDWPAVHETPAPEILAEWRDSCRDSLCNLYAYTTFAHGTETFIKDWLQELGAARGCIELGAGTGYVAMLLQRAGVDVIPLDSHPTQESSANEYHGSTPAFVNVQTGLPASLRHVMPSSDYALLLCYPPPRSPMAIEAVQSYLALGGQCLIYIGEIGGLTGSLKFEKLLQSDFTFVGRMPCLTWGTDAADVMVFRATDDMSTAIPRSRPLLSCSNCGKMVAKKRCRLVRHLVYCGERCFKEHRPYLENHLKMSGCEVPAVQLDYNKGRHFMSLDIPKSDA